MRSPLLQLSPLAADSWNLGDAFEGTAIFGRSGSGKTSGSGAALAKSFLRAGMGGIVLCAKQDEADNWERYAAETGRSDSIIRFDGSGRHRFNLLEYEMQRENVPADILASNVVSTLQNVIEVATRAGGLSAGRGGDVFWEKSSRMFLTMAVDLLYATTGRVRLGELVNLINSAPQSPKEMHDEEWRAKSFFYSILREFYATDGGAFPPSVEEAHQLGQFWGRTFPNMTEKTRSNIVTTILTDLGPLLRGKMRTLFSTDTNIIPEMTRCGIPSATSNCVRTSSQRKLSNTSTRRTSAFSSACCLT